MFRLNSGLFAALLFPLSACSGNPAQSPWEIQLVMGEDCGACSLFEEVRGERGIGEVLETGDDRLPEQVPVRTIAPAGLTDEDVRTMGALPYLDEEKARQLATGESLVVIVRHDGRIRAAGNIAWSTNLPRARFPESVMDPPASGPFEEIVEDPSEYYRVFFGEHWSLEYFLELALDPGRALPHDFATAYEPKGAGTFDLAASNVFLVGSASTPSGNPLFIPERIREVRDTLSRFMPEGRIHVFFGDGGGRGNDTSVEHDGELGFRPVNLGGERSLDGQTLVDWFAALREQDTKRNLIVQVGHGAPWGMPIWGHLETLSADGLREFHEDTGAENVIVSGACFGGIFAESASCGFFAARPDVVAAGCQRSPAAIAESDDYPRWYFRSLEPRYRAEADADGDGAISFREAHWFAATRLEHDQIPYTTLDALADRHFENQPSALPVSLTPGALRLLSESAPPAESRALASLTERVPDGRAIDLTNPAGQKRKAARRLDGLADAESSRRNEAMSLPYRLALVQLARRLVYRSVAESDVSAVDACESRNIPDFLH